jgi:hypothetical protein
MKRPVPYSLQYRIEKRAILSGMQWDPAFVDRSPMLAPLAQSAEPLRACAGWPRRAALQELLTAAGVTNAGGAALRLVDPEAAKPGGYERAIYERAELEVREGQWHDLFNVLAWLAYPRTKAALNARHVHALREKATSETRTSGDRNRGRVQDALTVFDESGAIFAAPDQERISELQAFRWKDLFWHRRDRFAQNARVFVFGHAIFEKALAPYVGMTAHALPLVVAAGFMAEPPKRQLETVDELAARRVADPRRLATPQALAPLPLLGVPGWWKDNEQEGFYDNAAYFRGGRDRTRG